jgi:hypothetical protein
MNRTATRPIAPSYPLSPADRAAHEAATHFRRPSSKAEQIDAAYAERDAVYAERERLRRAMVTAERAAAGAL